MVDFVDCQELHETNDVRRFGIRFSRQLPVSITVDVAEVLEHQPVVGAQSAIPRTWTTEVLEARNHGRGHLLRSQGGFVPLSSCSQVRHTLSDVCSLRQQGAQYART